MRNRASNSVLLIGAFAALFLLGNCGKGFAGFLARSANSFDSPFLTSEADNAEVCTKGNDASCNSSASQSVDIPDPAPDQPTSPFRAVNTVWNYFGILSHGNSSSSGGSSST